MLTRDFSFDLPKALIAQRPLPERAASKMLVYRRTAPQEFTHTHFRDLMAYLKPGDVLVFNQSKVIPARLYAYKPTGGKVELLVERCLSETQFLAHIRSSKGVSELHLSETITITVQEKRQSLYHCTVNQPILEVLKAYGHIPLPPYIEREADTEDLARYQTVYAKEAGSVAAPTAGLHFDEAMLKQLQEGGIDLAYTTLHVGAGTFKPVRAERIDEHVMHAEWMQIDEALCKQINQAKRERRRVIAVGTTALRALESAAVNGLLQPYQGETSIFITPGYAFQIIDGLMTNFHLPETTLLMLVSALIGYEPTMALYQEAIAKEYRFFSYGDVSLLI